MYVHMDVCLLGKLWYFNSTVVVTVKVVLIVVLVLVLSYKIKLWASRYLLADLCIEMLPNRKSFVIESHTFIHKGVG